MFFLVKGQNMTLQTYSNANFISEFNFENKSLIKHSGSTSKINLLSSITPMVLLQKIKLLPPFYLF